MEMENLPIECASPDQIREFVAQEGNLEGLCRLQLAWLDGRSESGEPVPAMAYARAHAGTGDVDAAFEWLEEAFERKEPGLLGIGVDPKFDPLRDDLRFASLIERVGLPL